MSDFEVDQNSTWANCPEDILLTILKYLDLKSIVICMGVNVHWRNMINYYCEHSKLWNKMIKNTIDNEGVTYKEKTMLGNRDQFFCAQQWLDIRNVSVHFIKKHKFEYIRNICVHKDTLIVASDTNVQHFNIENGELIKTMRKPCLNYEETLSFTFELTLPHCALTEFNVLTLVNKLNENNLTDDEVDKLVLYDVNLYKNHLNCCYLLDLNNVLWVYKATKDGWVSKILAKHFGNQNSVGSLHVHKKNIYAILKRGDVLLVDKKRKKFEKIFYFDLPQYNPCSKLFMFHCSSAILKVPNEDAIKYAQVAKDKITMTCPGVTYVLEHGHCLILGYNTGKVEIYIIKKLFDEIITPELQFYVQNYLDTTVSRIKITSIDLYEEKAAHRLFVTTVTDIYELLLKHE